MKTKQLPEILAFFAFKLHKSHQKFYLLDSWRRVDIYYADMFTTIPGISRVPTSKFETYVSS